MKIVNGTVADVKIIIPEINSDFRGYVLFPYVNNEYLKMGIDFKIRQINQGFSNRAFTVRGLHYQENPYEQAKLVSCLQGSLYSVAVDIRSNSPTFRKYVMEHLSFENQRVMYIPRGFAHGYITLEDNTLIQWCVDADFNKEASNAIRFDDPDIGIDWPLTDGKYIISEKDSRASLLRELK